MSIGFLGGGGCHENIKNFIVVMYKSVDVLEATELYVNYYLKAVIAHPPQKKSKEGKGKFSKKKS